MSTRGRAGKGRRKDSAPRRGGRSRRIAGTADGSVGATPVPADSRLRRVYLERIPAPGEVAQLEDAEARHLCGALRARPGAPLELLDGCGRVARAELEETVPATVRVLEVRSLPRPIEVHLALAVARGERFDWLVEKATELGVASIEPVVFARSLAGRSARRGDRWRRLAIAAMKQSGQAWLPRIDAPRRLDAVLDLPCASLVVCDLGAAEASAASILAQLADPLRLLIGPEGGFEAAEREQVRRRGCHVLGLPGATLRIETAALAAVVLALDSRRAAQRAIASGPPEAQ